jgi:anaerobic dimethyl sulfoxide reductase subunit C
MRTAGREWPLVAFTLLTQAAVGAFVALGAVRLFVQPAMADEAVWRALGGPLVAVAATFAAGIAASAGHLARPWMAWRAVRNAARSWLSLEILMAAGFAMAGALFAGAGWLYPDGAGPREILAGVAASFGVGLVYAMGRVYRLSTRPAWNHAATSIGFFATAALLGALAAAGALALTGYRAIGPASAFPDHVLALDRAIRALLSAALVGMALEAALVVLDLQMHQRASGSASLPAVRPSAAGRRRAAAWRAACIAIAGGAAAWVVFREPAISGAEPAGAAAIGAAFAAIAAESVLGRILFYTDPPIAGV